LRDFYSSYKKIQKKIREKRLIHLLVWF